MPAGEESASGIEGMPVLRANVHPDAAKAIKTYAASQGMSIRSMVRAILHEFAEDELGVLEAFMRGETKRYG